MRFLLFLTITAFSGFSAQARQIVCINDGPWGSVTTWSQVPTCSDTVTIPFGKEVIVSSQYSYLCAPPMKVIVAGILEFVNGYKLSLPCGSQVEILVNGLLKKATSGGGNSTLIEICGATVWNAGDGPISGYALLGVGPLPVTWLYLNADRKDDYVSVEWTTASEYNNDYFNLERSTDQYHFTSITKVTGAGNSTILRNYSFRDFEAPNGTVYYRIRQTDFDGRTTISKIVAVTGRNSTKFELIAVAGNNGQSLNIIFTEPSSSACSYRLIDLGGRTIDMGELEAGAGVLSRTVDVPFLQRGGMYVLQLTNGVEADSKRFIVN